MRVSEGLSGSQRVSGCIPASFRDGPFASTTWVDPRARRCDSLQCREGEGREGAQGTVVDDFLQEALEGWHLQLRRDYRM